ncbi:18351_t:CDS:2 [Funneliformis geosporum]|nr:18351_t:CDS:2 [Funneliformis geosporum]
MVLEYTDGDKLNDYLNEHLLSLKTSIDLVSAVGAMQTKYLYTRKILISNFGISRKFAKESSNASRTFDLVSYTGPRSSADQSKHFKINKLSNIYSVGDMSQLDISHSMLKVLDTVLIMMQYNRKNHKRSNPSSQSQNAVKLNKIDYDLSSNASRK